MKKEDMAKKLLRVLGQVDEDLIEEAAPGRRPKQRKLRVRYFLGAAAAVAVLVGAGIALHGTLTDGTSQSDRVAEEDTSGEILAVDNNGEKTSGAEDTEYDGTEEQAQCGASSGAESQDGDGDASGTADGDAYGSVGGSVDGETSAETGEADDITEIGTQEGRYYYEVSYGSVTYSDCAVSVEDGRLGDSLNAAVLTVWDSGEDTTWDVAAEVRGITEIQEKCAIAVWIEEEETWRAFVNTAYTAATLGEFVEDLNLRQDLSFGTVYGYDSSGETILYNGVDSELIWKLLFSNTGAAAVNYEDLSWQRVMSISVNLPVLGYTNISVSITEDGYLATNILATGKAFYIGEEAVAEFVEYVQNNYEGITYSAGIDSSENQEETTAMTLE